VFPAVLPACRDAAVPGCDLRPGRLVVLSLCRCTDLRINQLLCSTRFPVLA